MTGERPTADPPVPLRDARPFVAHYLRCAGDDARATNGAGLHLLARWVENLPAHQPSMRVIETTGALDYRDGSLDAGSEASRLVEGFDLQDRPETWEPWLAALADAVTRRQAR